MPDVRARTDLADPHAVDKAFRPDSGKNTRQLDVIPADFEAPRSYNAFSKTPKAKVETIRQTGRDNAAATGSGQSQDRTIEDEDTEDEQPQQPWKASRRRRERERMSARQTSAATQAVQATDTPKVIKVKKMPAPSGANSTTPFNLPTTSSAAPTSLSEAPLSVAAGSLKTLAPANAVSPLSFTLASRSKTLPGLSSLAPPSVVNQGKMESQPTPTNPPSNPVAAPLTASQPIFSVGVAAAAINTLAKRNSPGPTVPVAPAPVVSASSVGSAPIMAASAAPILAAPVPSVSSGLPPSSNGTLDEDSMDFTPSLPGSIPSLSKFRWPAIPEFGVSSGPAFCGRPDSPDAPPDTGSPKRPVTVAARDGLESSRWVSSKWESHGVAPTASIDPSPFEFALDTTISKAGVRGSRSTLSTLASLLALTTAVEKPLPAAVEITEEQKAGLLKLQPDIDEMTTGLDYMMSRPDTVVTGRSRDSC